MKRNYKLYINDIRESIVQIEEYTKGISEEDFKKDKKIQDAVIRRFEIMGEASRSIPKSLKEKNKEVPWFEMSQFRDLIAHSYYEMSIVRVWNSVKKRIPFIKEKIKSIRLV